MPLISIRIPQLGEGLQEALVVDFLKMPGDNVARDEPLYTMETDKGTSDVESPCAGKLVNWLVETGTVQAIGAAIVELEVAEGVEVPVPSHSPPAATATEQKTANQTAPAAAKAARNRGVPPRTRRYLRELGLAEEAHLIPSKSGKLMPEDVDAYLATRDDATGSEVAGSGDESAHDAVQLGEFHETPVPKDQQKLNYRLSRGTQICVPVVITSEVDWRAIDACHHQLKESAGDKAPKAFTLMLWCVVRAMARHPKFRSTLVNNGTVLRTFENVNLGVAVALPSDLLVTAVVQNAQTLSWSAFADAVRQQILLARDGTDQATASTTVMVSNMGSVGVRSGIAAVVPPAVATMTLGETFEKPVPTADGFTFAKTATICITFDHRIVNGAGAAQFMMELKQEIENLSLPEA